MCLHKAVSLSGVPLLGFSGAEPCALLSGHAGSHGQTGKEAEGVEDQLLSALGEQGPFCQDAWECLHISQGDLQGGCTSQVEKRQPMSKSPLCDNWFCSIVKDATKFPFGLLNMFPLRICPETAWLLALKVQGWKESSQNLHPQWWPLAGPALSQHVMPTASLQLCSFQANHLGSPTPTTGVPQALMHCRKAQSSSISILAVALPLSAPLQRCSANIKVQFANPELVLLLGLCGTLLLVDQGSGLWPGLFECCSV